MATKKNVEVIFTRVRGLASVVWDPEKNKALARFTKQGLLKTTNPRVVQRLDEMGYKRVTPAQVAEAGLTVPEENEGIRAPGRGYTLDGEGRPTTAFPPDGPAHTNNPLFDPDDFPTGPHMHKRTLVE